MGRLLGFILVGLTVVGCASTNPNQSAADEMAGAQGTSSKMADPGQMEIVPDIPISAPISDGAVFTIRGSVARQVYRQLTSVGVRSTEGEQEVVNYSSSVEISCTRSGGILPAGIRGFPPPISYECLIKKARPGQSDGSAKEDVVVLKNGAAKRFFGSLAGTPIQKDEKVEKLFRGEIVIICKGSSKSLDGAKCEGARVAH